MDRLIIADIHYYLYDLPLNRSLHVRAIELQQRRGALIEIFDDAGHTGLGEVAPLAGLSGETLEQSVSQLKENIKVITGRELTWNHQDVIGSIDEFLGAFKLYPSLRCGIEMALINLLAQRSKVPLVELLTQRTVPVINVIGLIAAGEKQVVDQAQKMIADGYQSIKLKVSADIDKEVIAVRKTLDAIQGKATLRLDANQGWDMNKAIQFNNEIGCDALEYIEEPFKDVADLDELYAKTTFPVALDESLSRLSWGQINKLNGVRALILKPTILGGLAKCWMLAQKARRAGMHCVISSSFESPVGIYALAHLAAALPGSEHWGGIDTLKYYAQDLLKDPIKITNGQIGLQRPPLTIDDLDPALLKGPLK